MSTTIKHTVLAGCFGLMLSHLGNLPALKAQDANESQGTPAPHVQTQPVGQSPLKVALREFTDGSHESTFSVLGLKQLATLQALSAEKLRELFVVRVQQTHLSTAPPVLGSYSVTDSELQFASRFPLSPFVKYSVELSEKLTGTAAAPIVFSPRGKELAPAPKVVAIYPTAAELPENLLKFYIHFSAPMSRGEAYQRIHLMHAGTEVADPFLELGEELWDVDQTRFTLLIHPGRIKRGVKPREDDGLPMTDGKDYELHIDAAWIGADHQPLSGPHIKKFRIVAADEEQPNPVNWKIGTPKAETQQPVSLTFNEPLDHAMLNRVLLVRDPAGELIEGKVIIDEQETVWSFAPNKPWKRSDYAIEVATNLEDLVGNSIARPFETKMQLESSDATAAAPLVAIEFTVE